MGALSLNISGRAYVFTDEELVFIPSVFFHSGQASITTSNTAWGGREGRLDTGRTQKAFR